MKLAVTALFALLSFGAIVVVSETAGVAAAPSCTKVGTTGHNLMAGTPHKDVICALAGNDYATGNRGADKIRGGPGNDTVVGNGGPDHLVGGAGNDRLFSNDSHRGNDTISGGAGIDACFGDIGDRFKGCESISRGASDTSMKSSLAAVDGSVSLGEEAQASPSPTPPPTTGGTTTVTITVTAAPPAGAPQCTPPPNVSPASC